MARLNDLEEDCENCEPITREDDSLQTQLNEVVELREKSLTIHDDVVKTQSDYKVMVANGDVMDDYQLQKDIDAVVKKDQRLRNRIDGRAGEIGRIQDQVQSFEAKITDALARIQGVSEAEERLGDVPVTVADIVRQQKEFEVQQFGQRR